jgi:hypothetical protein
MTFKNLAFAATILFSTAIPATPTDATQACVKLLRPTFNSGLSAFMSDPRFHWAEPIHRGLGIDLPSDRLPPNIFDRKIVALSYQPMLRLPDGLPQAEFAFFSGIFQFLRDRQRTYEMMKAVEHDVVRLAPKHEVEPRIRALLALFLSYEQNFGILCTTLHDAVTDHELHRLLLLGKTFTDHAGANLSIDMGLNIRPLWGRWPHRQLSHRLQLHLVLRDLMLHPNAYGNPQDVLTLYRQLGNTALMHGLNWQKTGLEMTSKTPSMFFQLFDSPENNGSSPGFFSEYQEYWQEILLR